MVVQVVVIFKPPVATAKEVSLMGAGVLVASAVSVTVDPVAAARTDLPPRVVGAVRA